MPATAPITAERDLDLALEDGRTLSYAVLGDHHADRTVVVLDGPGSRGLARMLDPAAREQGVRLLAPDRPGFGRSSPVAERSFAAVAADLAALAAAEGADRFGLLSQSGGTPYALAAAAGHRDHVAALAMVGPLIPFREPGALDGVSGSMKPVMAASRRAPFLLGPLFRMAGKQARKDPEKVARRVHETLPEPDRRILAEPRNWALHVQATRESLASPEAWAQEARMLAPAWDVDLAAIHCPVAIWVGELDTTHTPAMAHRMAERLGGPPVHVVPGVGAFALLPVLGDAVAFAAAAG